MTEHETRERAAGLGLELVRADSGFSLRTVRGVAITGRRGGVPLARVEEILASIEDTTAAVLADRVLERMRDRARGAWP